MVVLGVGFVCRFGSYSTLSVHVSFSIHVCLNTRTLFQPLEEKRDGVLFLPLGKVCHPGVADEAVVAPKRSRTRPRRITTTRKNIFARRKSPSWARKQMLTHVVSAVTQWAQSLRTFSSQWWNVNVGNAAKKKVFVYGFEAVTFLEDCA